MNCHLFNKPQWLFDKNPIGKVPVIELDSVVVADSSILADWVDEIYPKRKLWPVDITSKSLQRMYIEYITSVG